MCGIKPKGSILIFVSKLHIWFIKLYQLIKLNCFACLLQVSVLVLIVQNEKKSNRRFKSHWDAKLYLAKITILHSSHWRDCMKFCQCSTSNSFFITAIMIQDHWCNNDLQVRILKIERKTYEYHTAKLVWRRLPYFIQFKIYGSTIQNQIATAFKIAQACCKFISAYRKFADVCRIKKLLHVSVCMLSCDSIIKHPAWMQAEVASLQSHGCQFATRTCNWQFASLPGSYRLYVKSLQPLSCKLKFATHMWI